MSYVEMDLLFGFLWLASGGLNGDWTCMEATVLKIDMAFKSLGNSMAFEDNGACATSFGQWRDNLWIMWLGGDLIFGAMRIAAVACVYWALVGIVSDANLIVAYCFFATSPFLSGRRGHVMGWALPSYCIS